MIRSIAVFMLAVVSALGQTQTSLQTLKAGPALPAGASISGVVVFTNSGFFVVTPQQLVPLIAPLLPAPALNRKSLTVTTWDGNTASFTVPAVPIAGTLDVFKNGLLMTASTDYSTAAGNGTTVVTFVPAQVPQATQAGQPPDIVTATWFQ